VTNDRNAVKEFIDGECVGLTLLKPVNVRGPRKYDFSEVEKRLEIMSKLNASDLDY
jgi:hypothetical protein